MRFIFLTIFLAFSAPVFSQTVQSSCSASEDVIQRYREDAALLTLRRIYDNNDTYKDSAIIPGSHIDTVLNAMIAVYNATSIPERDTVIAIYNILPLYDQGLHAFSVSGDDEADWINQLEAGNQFSGLNVLDEINAQYNFTQESFYAWSWGYHSVTFVTTGTYNVEAIIQPLDLSPEVLGAYSIDGLHIGDYTDIDHTVNSDHVELRYILRWGDCFSGCEWERTYVFRVYYDCSVEFAESFGDVVPPGIVSSENVDQPDIMISPNPFTDRLTIKGITGKYEYSITDLLGKQVIVNRNNGSLPIDLSELSKGNYILLISNENMTIQKKVVKL